MGKISYSDHVKKSDISVVIAEIIFQGLKKTHKLLPLSKVVNTSSGGTPSRANQSYYGGEIPWLKSGEMNDSLIYQAEEFITEEGLNNSSAKIFSKGTLLVAMYGATAGKTGILDINASTNQAVCAVMPKDDNTNRDFLFWFFRAHRFYFIDISRGGAQPNISQSVIGNTDFPILKEGLQKNISLFLTNLEQAKEADYSLLPLDLCKPVKLAFDYLSCLQSIESENKKQADIVSKLKQVILQEAIAGQLTADWHKQNLMQKGNPDTDAAALLAKIKAEKQQLIADGKLKKEKPLAEIAIDEIPFSIPNNWVWTNFGNVIIDIEAGKSPDSLNHPASLDKWGVIKMSAISWDIFLEDENKQLKPNMPPFKDKEIKKGDFIMTRANTSELVAKSVIVGNVRDKLLLNDKTLRVRFPDFLSKEYFHRFNNGAFARSYYSDVAKGSSPSMKNITRENIKSLLIPLPPLAEQKAIVEKVDTLMNIIDQLEQQIKHRKQLAQALMQTVLREAFE